MQERLQKIIARAGITSRRRAEDLIRAGQVTVNGKVVTELGTRADPERDHIKVEGRLLRGAPQTVYVVLHKPSGCVSALSDPDGRPTVRPFLRSVSARVFPVGVLDYHAQGLLLLTNDGELANRYMQAPQQLKQTFWLKVKGNLSAAEVQGLQQQISARCRLVRTGDNPWYEVRLGGQLGSSPAETLQAMRSALIERGHPVEKCRRAEFGPLDLGRLQPGEFRLLEEGEASRLREAVGLGRPLDASVAEGTAPSGSRGRRSKKGPRRSASDTRSDRFGRGRR